ncbi:MAG: lysozyme inhibitor LprI family protein [Chthoniobacterales bacterium]
MSAKNAGDASGSYSMKLFTFTLLLLGVFLCASPLSAQTKTKSKILPADWLPALAPSIHYALDQLKEADTQAQMNALSRQIAEMTDAQLYIAYVRLYEELDSKERAALVTEQTKWLKERAKAAKAGIESEGGSLAPLEANNAEVTFSEKRLRELRDRLKKLTHKDED